MGKPIIFEIVCALGKVIRLTKERWKHVAYKHPEIDKSYIEKAKEILATPDAIVKSGKDPTEFLYHKHYAKTYFGAKYAVAAVKHLNGDGFIVTIYLTSKIKSGELAWKKN